MACSCRIQGVVSQRDKNGASYVGSEGALLQWNGRNEEEVSISLLVLQLESVQLVLPESSMSEPW
jgi:hypothetical protein